MLHAQGIAGQYDYCIYADGANIDLQRLLWHATDYDAVVYQRSRPGQRQQGIIDEPFSCKLTFMASRRALSSILIGFAELSMIARSFCRSIFLFISRTSCVSKVISSRSYPYLDVKIVSELGSE